MLVDYSVRCVLVLMKLRNRPLPSLVRFHLELLVLPHHLEEPVVGVSRRVKSVSRRRAEGHLRGWRTHVGVLAADGDAWSVGHAVKLRAMIGRCDGWMGLLQGR